MISEREKMKIIDEIQKIRGVKRCDKGLQTDFIDENLQMLNQIQTQMQK
jgi:hypothetical protein